MNNSTLRLSLVVVKMLRFFTYLLGGLVVLFWILSFFPGIIEAMGLSVNLTEDGFYLGENKGQSVLWNEVSVGYISFAVLKALATLIVFLLILKESAKVIQSIDSLDTFRKDNIQSFRSMAGYFFVWFLIKIPGVSYSGLIGEGFTLKLGVHPMILIGTLVCMILSEIFKEGNDLMEENKMTI